MPPVARALPSSDAAVAGATDAPGDRPARAAQEFPGGVVAVADLDLDVAEGEFVDAAGPSGSGKTTVLRLIAGFEQPTAGTVALRGRDVTARRAVRPRRPHRLPGLRAVPAPVGGAQRRVPAAHRRGRPGRAPGAGHARAGHGPARRDGDRPPTDSPAASGSAWRWHARWSTGPPCCCSTSPRRAGPQAPRADADRAQADPAGVRDHVRAGHPRPGRGAHAGRPGRGLQRRPGRAGRARARGVRAAGHRVRRGLRRHLQRARLRHGPRRPRGALERPAREDRHRPADAPAPPDPDQHHRGGRRARLHRPHHPLRGRARGRRPAHGAGAERRRRARRPRARAARPAVLAPEHEIRLHDPSPGDPAPVRPS